MLIDLADERHHLGYENVRGSMFWGKAIIRNGEPVALLSLAAHSLDVAAVFRILVSQAVFRKRLEAAAGVDLTEEQLDRLAVLSLLHDAGKANLGFQDKILVDGAPKVGHIAPLNGLVAHFGRELAAALCADELSRWFEDGEKGLTGFLVASWSHHGEPMRLDSSCLTGPENRRSWWERNGERDPLQAMRELIDVARQRFPEAFGKDGKQIPAGACLQHRFAGLVMLADWLGSHQAHFPIDRSEDFDSLKAASRIVRSVGLDVSGSRQIVRAQPADFSARFGFEQMQPLQRAVAGMGTGSEESRLLIGEAETGSGKTEAALCRFFDLFAAGEVDSLYFALPTRVAARELYQRVRRYIERVFSDPMERPSVVLAVPGYSLIDGVPSERVLPESGVQWIDSQESLRRERAWAAEHPKRFLAAPIAVGTIDQALLSSLRVKHAHLRSVCLDRSLLVVDEVHASDIYMRQLLRCLLEHHLGVGGHAFLLSATLGSAARSELVAGLKKAYVPAFDEACQTPYPAITDGKGGTKGTTGEKRASRKLVRLEAITAMREPSAIVPTIQEALKAGCRVLVVLNTVSRAQELFRAAEQPELIGQAAMFRCNGVAAPHHGRFAPCDRELLDAVVSSRLGKGSEAGPVLLIGTQTLEQSLDIDADLLITDLCPIDVLLQRIGRLHRHARSRPAGYEVARCLVMVPDDDNLEELLSENGIPSQAAGRCGLGSVYEDMRVLHLTLKLIRGTPEIIIPDHNRMLVESGTHPERLAALSGSKMRQHGSRVEGANIAQATAANFAALYNIYEKEFNTFSFGEIENKIVRTRLGLDTLQLPLDKVVDSPFGAPLDQVVIPGHMAPSQAGTKFEKVLVDHADNVLITLTVGNRKYNYSRFGLEVADGSQ